MLPTCWLFLAQRPTKNDLTARAAPLDAEIGSFVPGARQLQTARLKLSTRGPIPSLEPEVLGVEPQNRAQNQHLSRYRSSPPGRILRKRVRRLHPPARF